MAVHSTMLPLGTEAPGFDLPDPSGRRWTLESFDGTPALLVAFLCNHCPYVTHIADVLATVTAELIQRGVSVVGISANDIEAYPDDAPERMAEQAARHGFRFPYLVDETQAVAAAYRAACTPDFFLFDRRRRLAYRGRFDSARPRTDAPVSGEDLLAAAEEVLSGQPVPEPHHPSMGCSIKWKPGNEPAWFG